MEHLSLVMDVLNGRAMLNVNNLFSIIANILSFEVLEIKVSPFTCASESG